MRKNIVVFVLLMLVTVLAAQAEADTMRFKLLDAEEYDLDMFYSSDLGRLFVQADFNIPKQELNTTDYYGMFLAQNAFIQSCTVAGFYEGHYYVQNLGPEFFSPQLPNPELLFDDSPVRFFGIRLSNFDSYPELTHFRVWYHIDVPAFTLNEQQKLATGLRADQFWYPRNVRENCTVRVAMTTTSYMNLLLGNTFAEKSDQQYTRIHKSTFIDSADQPVSLQLIRE